MTKLNSFPKSVNVLPGRVDKYRFDFSFIFSDDIKDWIKAKRNSIKSADDARIYYKRSKKSLQTVPVVVD